MRGRPWRRLQLIRFRKKTRGPIKIRRLADPEPLKLGESRAHKVSLGFPSDQQFQSLSSPPPSFITRSVFRCWTFSPGIVHHRGSGGSRIRLYLEHTFRRRLPADLDERSVASTMRRFRRCDRCARRVHSGQMVRIKCER